MEKAAQIPNIHLDQAAVIFLALTEIKSVSDRAQERRVHWRTYREQPRLSKREREAINEEKIKSNLLNWALESLGVPSQSREETYVQVMEMGPGFAGESGAQFFKSEGKEGEDYEWEFEEEYSEDEEDYEGARTMKTMTLRSESNKP
ncbi:uncharacterized protein CTHT_0074090 [Thermochaetoides thermophila DSM 1495]|uniref:Uncharacterized protein n=1 Tax=Chaetomium thermophilum (strain DSM 1495 / CBS 144.50 / IMI 039719) TaxID=759272 RepID=G0SI11_CHATD|nr:hypothetical protein CTHT_0074090 [Thermochaetoides thermophila DSM 1495]EGS17081.1 hypothetical protein CTHT_0074090 [Thermochaetoides thermophila DSM 1495]